jgi:hypothetical protein
MRKQPNYLQSQIRICQFELLKSTHFFLCISKLYRHNCADRSGARQMLSRPVVLRHILVLLNGCLLTSVVANVVVVLIVVMGAMMVVVVLMGSG